MSVLASLLELEIVSVVAPEVVAPEPALPAVPEPVAPLPPAAPLALPEEPIAMMAVVCDPQATKAATASEI